MFSGEKKRGTSFSWRWRTLNYQQSDNIRAPTSTVHRKTWNGIDVIVSNGTKKDICLSFHFHGLNRKEQTDSSTKKKPQWRWNLCLFLSALTRKKQEGNTQRKINIEMCERLAERGHAASPNLHTFIDGTHRNIDQRRIEMISTPPTYTR